MVVNFLRTIPLNVPFMRGLVSENIFSWYDLVSEVVTVNLSNGKDGIQWKLSNSGTFTVRYMHRSMIR